MSSADFNKVVGAILISLLAAVAIGIFINETMHPHMPHGDEMAFRVDTGASDGAPAAAAEKPMLDPVAPLLAAADVGAGEKLVGKRCTSCHTVSKGGAKKVGPNLYNVVGANKGAHPDFKYSDAMKAKGGAWDFASLNAFLASPKGFVPKTKMSYAGLKKVKDRAAVIAYLRSLADSPVPLP